MVKNTFLKLLTSRNKNIITQKQQEKIRKFTAGIAGLSVGSSILTTLVRIGGPNIIKIADFDTIELSNLNRMNAKASDIGKNKAIVASREAKSINPYLKLDIYPSGINESNLEKFILGQSKLKIFVDAMDSIYFKIKVRLICRKNRIPLVMATDLAHAVLLDIERYDKEPNREIFHGLLGKIDLNKLNNINKREWLRLANKIIGKKYISEKLKKSIPLVGKTLNNIPQLCTASNLAGSLVALSIIKIANSEKLLSGRYFIDLEKVLSQRLMK